METRERPRLSYQARIIRRRGRLYFRPVESSTFSVEGLGQRSFAEASDLFVKVLKALRRAGYTPHPDDPGQSIPDPFGILSGRKHIPWQLLNPAADEHCTRCHQVCVPDEVAGHHCYDVCTCGPC